MDYDELSAAFLAEPSAGRPAPAHPDRRRPVAARRRRAAGHHRLLGQARLRRDGGPGPGVPDRLRVGPHRADGRAHRTGRRRRFRGVRARAGRASCTSRPAASPPAPTSWPPASGVRSSRCTRCSATCRPARSRPRSRQLRRATDVAVADVAGRPLVAGLASLDWPDDAWGSLWHALNILREYRGDTHQAANVAAGLTGVQMNLVTEYWVGWEPRAYAGTRGWAPEVMDAADADLRERGWVADGALTATGQAERGPDRAGHRRGDGPGARPDRRRHRGADGSSWTAGATASWRRAPHRATPTSASRGNSPPRPTSGRGISAPPTRRRRGCRGSFAREGRGGGATRCRRGGDPRSPRR